MASIQEPPVSSSDTPSNRIPEPRPDPASSLPDKEMTSKREIPEPKHRRHESNGESDHDRASNAPLTHRNDREPLSFFQVMPILIVILSIGALLLAIGIYWQQHNPDAWWVLFLREAGAVLMVVAILHAIYEIVIHRVLRSDINRLGASVKELQRTFHIAEGALDSGLAAVYASRDEVNKAIGDEMKNMPDKATLKLLGISMGALLCPHGALHGAFRELLTRKDITIEALILNIESGAAVERAKLEEPREFALMPPNANPRVFFDTTRCHNELKTATDFVQDIAERCIYREEKSKIDELPPETAKKLKDAPNEPEVKASFSYRVYNHAPLCYLVIFGECLFLENYHNAGRGGESPVLKVARWNRESSEPTTLFKIYERHFKVMYDNASDLAEKKRKERIGRAARDGAVTPVA